MQAKAMSPPLESGGHRYPVAERPPPWQMTPDRAPALKHDPQLSAHCAYGPCAYFEHVALGEGTGAGTGAGTGKGKGKGTVLVSHNQLCI